MCGLSHGHRGGITCSCRLSCPSVPARLAATRCKRVPRATAQPAQVARHRGLGHAVSTPGRGAPAASCRGSVPSSQEAPATCSVSHGADPGSQGQSRGHSREAAAPARRRLRGHRDNPGFSAPPLRGWSRRRVWEGPGHRSRRGGDAVGATWATPCRCSEGTGQPEGRHHCVA